MIEQYICDNNISEQDIRHYSEGKDKRLFTNDSELGLPEMQSIGFRLLERLPINCIELLPLESRVTCSGLREKFPAGKLVVCDLYIEKAETQQFLDYGFSFGEEQILNIDHHADHPKMTRQISAGNLACRYVEQQGIVSADSRVVINHTDCDSIISSLILRGLLPNNQIFEEAVLAADHRGTINPISDLLQALDCMRDINFSARNLAFLLMGEPLESAAQKLLDNRMQGRKETELAVLGGQAVKNNGELTVVELSDSMRNEFLPALFPDAVVILTFEKGKGAGNVVTRLRLGNAAPEGFNLFSLPLKKLDPNFGGRWNAGSNKRGGGTEEPLDLYISRFKIALRNILERS